MPGHHFQTEDIQGMVRHELKTKRSRMEIIIHYPRSLNADNLSIGDRQQIDSLGLFFSPTNRRLFSFLNPMP
jgi:hypothetical protein